MSEIRINKIFNVPQRTNEQKGKKDTAPEQEITKKPELNQKKAGDVLDYMANSSLQEKAFVQNSKNIDVSKYVDEESADRIGKVMKSFEETILQSAEKAIKEFGLSEAAAQDIAIMGFGQRYLV